MSKTQVYYGIFLFLTLLPSSAFVSAQGSVCIYFFYGNGCLACDMVKPKISELEQNYPQLSVCQFEVYDNRSNVNLLNGLFDKYSVPEDRRKIPAVFIDDKCFVGTEQITEELEGAVQSLLGTGCPCPIDKETI